MPKEKQELPYVTTKADKAAVAKISREWKKISDSLNWDLRDKFNDKYNADDCKTEEDVKRLVLGHVMRWLWEDVYDLGGPNAVMEQFINNACGIASRGIDYGMLNDYPDPPFNEGGHPLIDIKKFLDWKPTKKFVKPEGKAYWVEVEKNDKV